MGLDIVASTATSYKLDGPAIESWWKQIFQTSPQAHPVSCTKGTGSLCRKQSSRGMAVTTHPHLMLRLKKENSYTPTPPVALHGPFYGELNSVLQ